ncbi:unnamed protein product [Acanthocheilonema viteae]|uniref:TATA box-binding protein-like 1 n=1 Tax=Acanthocheilonema viteae TaxID=6277 RepID=A0A498SEQ9_ACAVI|nr:unnamed protein product [Acanthocheilonema viteae]
MSISACQNDHGSYTLNGSSVTTGAAAKGSIWHSNTTNSFLEGFNSQHSISTRTSLLETSGSQHSTVLEFSQSQTDSFHLDVPVHEDDGHLESIVYATGRKMGYEKQTEEAPPSTSSEIADRYDSDEDGEIDIQIRNVVCNYTLPLHIDLHRVALSSGNVAFDRGRGVLLKQKRNPSCYVKIYSSGKIYIVGCRSESECKRAARGVARMVQKSMGRMMDVVRIRNYRVCNVLATCKMPFGVKIEEIVLNMNQNYQLASYGVLQILEPLSEFIPQAALRLLEATASENDVMKAIEVIYPIIKEFRCALRLRNATISKPSRKRKHGPSLHGFQRFPSSSGVYGNRVYFSDEDDEEEDEFEDVV